MGGTNLFPDADGALALKLFMTIEIERFRNIVEKKDDEIEKGVVERNKLEFEMEKNSINIKQIPTMKKTIKEQETNIQELTAERDDLSARLKQTGLKGGSARAANDRVRYLEKQMEILNTENKKLNANIGDHLTEIDSWTEKFTTLEAEFNTLNAQLKMSVKKNDDFEINIETLRTERSELLEELEKYKERERKFKE